MDGEWLTLQVKCIGKEAGEHSVEDETNRVCVAVQGTFDLELRRDFDFEIRISAFPIKHEIQKQFSTSRNPFSMRISF